MYPKFLRRAKADLFDRGQQVDSTSSTVRAKLFWSSVCGDKHTG